MMDMRGFLMLLFLTFSSAVAGQEPKLTNSMVHEGYITRITEPSLVEALPKAPPPPKEEVIPDQISPEAVWIPGYWTWLNNQKDYGWICGIWRVPPPAHVWINGYWKQFDEGWVWIRGFWSPVSDQSLSYIKDVPPDQLDENVSTPPSNDYFWNSGYWIYSSEQNKFNWVAGHWEKFDPEWILVPAHYVWRQEGYVFIPSYWDWPLDLRGRAYFCLEPVVSIEPIALLHTIVVYYPDYLNMCGYYYHFYPDYWVDCFCNPPWWNWQAWWSLSWHDHWGCWWWYTHPGYPQPIWITQEISAKIPTPPLELISHFKKISPPPIVTPKGVVSPNQLLSAKDKLYGRGKKQSFPIVPLNPKIIGQIGKQALDKEKISQVLLPTGGKDLTKVEIPKPKIGEGSKKVQPIESVKLPIKPNLPSSLKPAKMFPNQTVPTKTESKKPMKPDIKPMPLKDFDIPEKPIKKPVNIHRDNFQDQWQNERTKFKEQVPRYQPIEKIKPQVDRQIKTFDSQDQYFKDQAPLRERIIQKQTKFDQPQIHQPQEDRNIQRIKRGDREK
jgi:hypothetical protein